MANESMSRGTSSHSATRRSTSLVLVALPEIIVRSLLVQVAYLPFRLVLVISFRTQASLSSQSKISQNLANNV